MSTARRIATDLQSAVHAYDGRLNVAIGVDEDESLTEVHVQDGAESLTLVPLTLRELAALRRDSDRMQKLEAAGVDNWEGYGNAFREDDGS